MMSEPTKAMMRAGWTAFATHPDQEYRIVSAIYLAMKALDPDTHRASSDEVGRAITAYLDAFDNATGTVYVEPLMREALAAMSVQSDKGEG